jgi:hypothetical protein
MAPGLYTDIGKKTRGLARHLYPPLSSDPVLFMPSGAREPI